MTFLFFDANTHARTSVGKERSREGKRERGREGKRERERERARQREGEESECE